MEPSFADRLTDWLRYLRLRQADLARALGVSKAAVTGWTTGGASPSMERLDEIVAALRIPGGVPEFFARMPAADEALNRAREDAIAVRDAVGPHPSTGEDTREIDIVAMERERAARPCPTCGRTGEAA